MAEKVEGKLPADHPPVVDTAAIAAAARTAERERMSAIMALPEAKGREDLARGIATGTDLDVATAKALLATAPMAIANPLAAAMAKEANPKVGPEAAGGELSADDASLKELRALYAVAGVGKDGK